MIQRKRAYRIGIDARLYSQTGVGRYTRFLLEELAKIDRNNQYLVLLNRQDYSNAQPLNKNFTFYPINIRWHTFSEQLIFPFILLKLNLDLVHFPYFSVPFLYPKPFVVTIHDLTPLTHATGRASSLPFPIYQLKHLGYKFILSTITKKSCHIIAPSKSTAESLCKFFTVAEDKVTVTYEGAKTINKPGKISLIEGKYFLYVGNAYPHKNVTRLIHAFIKANLPTKLVLVGEKDFFYQRLIKEFSSYDKIIFFGAANDDKLANLYTHALALVCPSYSEGFGLPAVEAMKYGCLVIASYIPTFREIYKQAVIYIDPFDEQEIAEKLKSVYENPTKYTRIRNQAKERVKAFRWDKMARQTFNVYERCLNLRSSK